jgi:hypothetical protein
VSPDAAGERRIVPASLPDREAVVPVVLPAVAPANALALPAAPAASGERRMVSG